MKSGGFEARADESSFAEIEVGADGDEVHFAAAL
jgi:hypothetical protein